MVHEGTLVRVRLPAMRGTDSEQRVLKMVLTSYWSDDLDLAERQDVHSTAGVCRGCGTMAHSKGAGYKM